MKSNEKPNWRKQRQPETVDDGGEYPLGARPSAIQLTRSIRQNPSVVMRSWDYHDELNVNENATQLFIGFTKAMFSLCNRQWRAEGWVPRPTTLKEAMEMWSIEQVRMQLPRAHFLAISAPEWGGQGRKARTFQERAEIFFPKHQLKPKAGSSWSILYNKTDTAAWYIKEYQTLCITLGNQDVVELQECIENIFNELQCLPNSIPFTQHSTGCTWTRTLGEIVVITNPKYYRVLGVSSKATKRGMGIAPAQARRREALEDLKLASGLTLQEARRQELQEKTQAHGSRRKRHLSQRSAQSRNARKPPVKNRTHPTIGSGQSRNVAMGKSKAYMEIDTSDSSDGNDEQSEDEAATVHHALTEYWKVHDGNAGGSTENDNTSQDETEGDNLEEDRLEEDEDEDEDEEEEEEEDEDEDEEEDEEKDKEEEEDELEDEL